MHIMSDHKQTRKAAADARPIIAMEEKEYTKRMKKQSQKKSQERKKKTKSTPSPPKSNKKIRIEGGGYELNSGNWIPGTSGGSSTGSVEYQAGVSHLEMKVLLLH